MSVAAGDCNDADPTIAPGMPEICDGIDQDCNAIADDNPTDGDPYFRDDDGDGFGDPKVAQVACASPEGFVANDEDCDDTDPDKNPSGQDTLEEDFDCDGKPLALVPIAIQTVDVACDISDQVVFEVTTAGVTSGGVVFSQETDNDEPQYADEHDLDSVAPDVEKQTDALEQQLVTSVLFDDRERNVATLFRCGSHYDAVDVMTYIVAVFDENGDIADCVAVGHDGNGALNNTYQRIDDPSFDTSTCVEASL